MKKTQKGIIVSTNTAQTAVVEVVLWKIARLIKKRYKVNRRFMAHNPKDEFKVGDMVEIVETRPISKRKHHLITKKLTAKEIGA